MKIMTNKLFAVMLGGNPSGAGIEVHDVVFTVGPTIDATRDQMRAAWFAGGKPPHIDSWMELDVVDGARILVTDEAAHVEGPDLWHVNLGYYEGGAAGFIEGHENVFVVAASAGEAKAKAKKAARRAPIEALHTDVVNRVSDRLALAGSPYRVRVDATGETGTPVARDGYQPLDE